MHSLMCTAMWMCVCRFLLSFMNQNGPFARIIHNNAQMIRQRMRSLCIGATFCNRMKTSKNSDYNGFSMKSFALVLILSWFCFFSRVSYLMLNVLYTQKKGTNNLQFAQRRELRCMHNVRKRLDIEQKQTSILLDLFIDSMVFHPIHFDYRHVLRFSFVPFSRRSILSASFFPSKD